MRPSKPKAASCKAQFGDIKLIGVSHKMLLCISYLTLLFLLLSIVPILTFTLFVTLTDLLPTACGATNALKCSSRPVIHPHLRSSTRCVECALLSCPLSVRVSIVHLCKGALVSLHTAALHMPTYLFTYIHMYLDLSAYTQGSANWSAFALHWLLAA